MPYAILLITAAVLSVGLWPGLVNGDSHQSIYEATTGELRDWWSPFWAAMLALSFEVSPDTGLVFAAHIAVFAAGTYLCLRSVLRRVPAAVLVPLVCAFPPFLGALVAFSRDAGYLGLTLLAFGFLGRGFTARDSRAEALSWVAATGFAVLVFLMRQNGIAVLAVVVLAIAVRYVSLHRSWWPRWKRAACATGIAGAAVISVVAATLATYRVAGVLATHPERFTYIYDLAAVSIATDRQYFPEQKIERQRAAGWMAPPDPSLPALETMWDERNVIALYYPGGVDHTRSFEFSRPAEAATESRLLREAWLDAIVSEPLAYLEARGNLLLASMGIGGDSFGAYTPIEFDNFGWALAHPGIHDALGDYLLAFVGFDSAVPLDLPWVYLVLGLIAVAILWRRRLLFAAPMQLAFGAAAALSLGIAFLAIPASAFRYVNLIVPAALLLCLTAAAAYAARSRAAVLLDPDLVELATGASGKRPGAAT